MNKLKLFSLAVFSLFASACLPADEDPVTVAPMTGQTLQPDMAGPREPYQVWVDLSEENGKNMTRNLRTDWDLAFYTGDQYRVIINSSMVMAVGKIPNVSNIDEVTEPMVEELKNHVMIGNFLVENLQYMDNPSGQFLTQTTGIAPISAVDSENPIYLLNLGYDLPDESTVIAPGSYQIAGVHRGWMKLQILRAPDGYKVRYGSLNAKGSEIKEYIITKNTDYHFNFFSLIKGQQAMVHPKKKSWDLGFTVFVNEVFYNTGESAGGYIYPDFVVTNILDNVGAYQVNVPSGVNADEYYRNFKLANVDASKLIFDDQRAIGGNWRNTTGSNGAQVYGDRFYVIKDPDGFFFKLRFNKMKNDLGERGYPEFEYEAL